MMHPSRIDGEPLRVVTLPDGRVFVDTPMRTYTEGGIVTRSGPEHPRHFHRFDDYGLADGLLRCAKCGLVVEAGTENYDGGKEVR